MLTKSRMSLAGEQGHLKAFAPSPFTPLPASLEICLLSFSLQFIQDCSYWAPPNPSHPAVRAPFPPFCVFSFSLSATSSQIGRGTSLSVGFKASAAASQLCDLSQGLIPL